MNIFWNKIFGVLNHSVFKNKYREWINELNLEGNEKVIDFGCGVGGSAFHIAKKLEKGKLVCVDVSDTAMSIAKKKLKRFNNVDFYIGDIRSLNLDSKSFDIIYISFVLYHIDEKMRKEIIQYMSKLLKDNGRIVIRNFIGEHSMSPENLKEFMHQCNFKVKETYNSRTFNRIPTYFGSFNTSI